MMYYCLIHTIEAHRRERDLALQRTLLPRQLGASLTEALSSRLVKVVTGPRRAGKSTPAFQVLAGECFAYLNFEDDALRGDISGDELVEAIDSVHGETDFLFFDEIQNYPHWESFINKLHRRGRNMLITGSNSRSCNRIFSSRGCASRPTARSTPSTAGLFPPSRSP